MQKEVATLEKSAVGAMNGDGSASRNQSVEKPKTERDSSETCVPLRDRNRSARRGMQLWVEGEGRYPKLDSRTRRSSVGSVVRIVIALLVFFLIYFIFFQLLELLVRPYLDNSSEAYETVQGVGVELESYIRTILV